MAKHTPGPWTLEGKRGDGKVIFVTAPGDGWERLWAEICSDDCDPDTALANAALIAAAPDLLEACKDLVARAEQARQHPGTVREALGAVGLYRMAQAARAAIAKAEKGG